MANQVVLFLSHLAPAWVVREYNIIRRATRGIAETCFLYHTDSGRLPRRPPAHEIYPFSRESLKALGYQGLGGYLVPGYAYLPVLQFFRDHPGFDHYWVVEYDARFSGDWRLFFSAFEGVEADFVACHIRSHAEESRWMWWALDHPRESVPIDQRLRSFNAVYRVSRGSLPFLHQCLQDGWRGHHEVLWATLLHRAGFTLMDMGGRGRFTPPEMVNRFYVIPEFHRGTPMSASTMRCRPVFWKLGPRPNQLHHPVKPLPVALLANAAHFVWKLAPADGWGGRFRWALTHFRARR